MSLINQMLQDLEQRQSATGSVAAQVRAVDSARKPPSKRWIAWLAVGGLAVLGIAGVVAYSQNRASQPVAAPEVPEPAAPATPAPGQAVAPQPVDEPLVDAPTVLQLASMLATAPEIRQPPASASQLIPVADLPQPKPGERAAPIAAPAPVPARQASAPKADAVINKEVRQLSARQRAENLYQQAYASLQQSRMSDAEDVLKQALQQDAGHAVARQALAVLMIETNRIALAEKTLQDGLAIQPDNTAFALTLARIQVERANISGALATLQQHMPADENPDYHAFLAALLQKTEQHKAAIEQYQIALRSNPTAGAWLIGLGISCQADQQIARAQEAFQRARQSKLSPELQAFVDQRLRQLQ